MTGDQQVAQDSVVGDILGGVGSEPTPGHAGRAWAWVASVVVVLAGLYVGAQWLVSDKVPHGTSVAGVEIGGLSVDQASARLTSALADAQQAPVAVVAAGRRMNVDPSAAGLAVDVPGTVRPLAGFGLSPVRLWHAVTGVDDVTPAVTVDTPALDAQLAKIADVADKAPVDGAVAFVGGAATSTAPRDGTSVDRTRARAAITAHWLRSEAPITLPTRTVHPDVGTTGTQYAMVIAGTIASAPVEIAVGSKHVSLPGDVVARATTFVPDGSGLTPKLDGGALRADVLARQAKLVRPAKNASFVFVKGKPTIKGGANGTGLDASKLAAAVSAAATKSSGRTATVALTTVRPATTSDDLASLRITKVVSSFATHLTHEPVRTKNLVVGAKKITGDLVKPGQTFSILDALAPITKASGYHEAHMIMNGQIADTVGGGLSQVATTTYNAAYFAGLDIVTHKPHSYYFSRYPVGREATIAAPSIDMKFTNDAPTGILVRSWVGGGKLHVQLWGTPYYSVKSTTSPRQDVVEPRTVHDAGSSCVADPGGSPGFLVRVRRVVSHGGDVVKDETSSWRYLPENRVVCTGHSGGK